jgi:hypothetical protein
MLNLHDDAFARIGLEKVDAYVTDSFSEIEPDVNSLMVDREDIPYVAAPNVDVSNAVV